MTAPSGRPRAAWRFAHVLMTLAFGSALGACFNAPSGAVLFACDAETAPSCPAGYSCEADGCCHRDGSDIAAELGSCRIGGGMSATGGSDTDTAATTAATTAASDTAATAASSGPTSSSTGADTASSGTTT